jgi:hypothetical protein
MTTNEIRQILFDSAKLRMPTFTERDTAGMRIEALEEYLLKMAVTRGDLEEARLHCQQALLNMQRQWENLQGWEVHIPSGTRRPYTGPVIREAKRLTDTALTDAIDDAKWLNSRLAEQISRLSKVGDDQVASRVYTLMVGS